ncbi:GntR family transcriptional regulator [Oceanicella sp. SM1341]|uniref:GntR family transcriptional regulator n=1 Tax=Oceanicella sp. SM1341 TaxID=1548889 RepID=UPI000E52E72F|nr:GntR family transcriptional regulator [Oceanicella sp. SM1341]
MDIAAAAMKPAQRGVSLAEQIYRNLRSGIISGQIPAGVRLREVELAEMLGASRTPLREALSRLAGDGLLTPLSKGGVEVVDVESERDDIHAIRVGLECVAVRLAAERITEAELEELFALIVEREEMPAADTEGRSRNNARLHELIREAARNPRLLTMIGHYQEFFLDAGRLALLDAEASTRAVRQHREIAEALRARNPDAAETALRDHLEHAYDSLKQKRRG